MQRNPGTPEFQDLIGNCKLRLSYPDLSKLAEFTAAIASGECTYPQIAALFDNDYDALSLAALDAFSRGQLSRQEMATLLDLRVIRSNEEITIIELLDES